MMFAQRPPRVLFVSYLFPPTGGVGVQRVSKFVKYLPQAGWESSVLTVSNASVPLHDESLVRDIPPGTLIRRAKTYEPGYALKTAVSGGNSKQGSAGGLVRAAKSVVRRIANTALQPDPQILWHPHAYREGLKLLQAAPHDAIIATGPPFSSFLLGAKLSRKTGLPLILDYRDEWDISNAYWENKGQGQFANWIQTRQQASALRTAQVILATTPSSAAAIEEFARRHGSTAKAMYIYNGFDPDDYPAATAVQARTGDSAEKFRLAFIGTLWNLNSIQPVVEALLKISAAQPVLAGTLEIFLAGRRTPDQEAQLDRLQGTPITVTRSPFVSHDEAIDLMRSADALLMLNSDLPKTQRIINAKTFEYMAARRPMFVVAPQGDVWDVVRDLPGTVLCKPADIDGIAEKLLLTLELHRCGERFTDATWDISRFERRQLTRELAKLLDQTVADAHAGSAVTSPASGMVERPESHA
ncbi:glycosyltransferase [Planctomicrobium piriforme]|uniref:Glycosyltransferase involved in cell wall bisynthesis n=1 Tax=Planctomicrobium piriforme TaxID=1576369 RepID=A0A1I3CB27_9PLAN|nr:glycosyltransferase [Planctomicrobium piriforme]SFH71732.1 Glycosyltransferase involved in cell wall bisynthesis [Planctomicrobium piriforme]